MTLVTQSLRREGGSKAGSGRACPPKEGSAPNCWLKRLGPLHSAAPSLRFPPAREDETSVSRTVSIIVNLLKNHTLYHMEIKMG